MDDPFLSKHSRRKVLIAAAGTACLALSPVSALSALRKKTGRYTLAYWTGSQFVDAQNLNKGDSTLTSVSITLHSFGDENELSAVNWRLPPINEGTQPKFLAWSTPPEGPTRVHFVAGVDRELGLELEVCFAGETQNCYLRASGSGTPKLREGTYLLAAGSVNLVGLAYAPESTPPLNRWNVPVSIPYLLVHIKRV